MSLQNDEEKNNNTKEIVLWQNGKDKTFSFKYKIRATSKTSLSKFKSDIIIYIITNKDKISSINEIIHYNRLKDLEISKIKLVHLYTIKEIELDESDISYLQENDVLFFSFDNSSFQDSNHFYQYEFVKWIKSGGYGKVFLAKKIVTDKEYAIKQIDTSNFSTEEVYNISRENLILRTMNHKNVIKLYDSFTYDKKFYTVMDYARGGELTLLLEGEDGKKNNKLNEIQCKKIFKQIYDAVCYIHERNIIHRDLKPNNILFLDDEKTHVVIIDFGISGFSNGNNREKIKAGTTMFLPPETACGKEFSSNRKLDIWALGIILYRMIEGVYPFDGKNSKEIIYNIMKKNLEFNKKIRISKPLKTLIGGMLEKNHRFRIDDDSELFNKWFEYTPQKKTSVIEFDTMVKDSIFDTSNKKEVEKINNENTNINKEGNNQNNMQSFPFSNVPRGKSHKNNNKYKLFLNTNKDKKSVPLKQSGIDDINDKEINNKNKYSKFKKIIQDLNITPSSNNQEIEKNNKNKQLILPILSIKNIQKNSELLSPYKTKTELKKNSKIKTHSPIHGNNLFNNNNYSNIDKNDLNICLINKKENINNNNYGYFSNYSNRKRATSEFKNKIFQTINRNNLFNDKNNLYNNNIPSNSKNTTKNIIEQNITTVINDSPIKRNKYKYLAGNNRNISSYEMAKFPIIFD